MKENSNRYETKTFFIIFFICGFNKKFFLNTIEMVESPSQGVKIVLVVSWLYSCPYSVFKTLTTYSVYKALAWC